MGAVPIFIVVSRHQYPSVIFRSAGVAGTGGAVIAVVTVVIGVVGVTRTVTYTICGVGVTAGVWFPPVHPAVTMTATSNTIKRRYFMVRSIYLRDLKFFWCDDPVWQNDLKKRNSNRIFSPAAAGNCFSKLSKKEKYSENEVNDRIDYLRNFLSGQHPVPCHQIVITGGFSYRIFRLFQYAVNEHESQHGFCYRDDTGDDAGIMPAANGNLTSIAMNIPGLLDLCYRGSGFYCDPDNDILPG